MNKPHKHAAVIKAWADGAEIESKCGGDVTWLPMTAAHPTFSHHIEYRIKPEKKKVWILILRTGTYVSCLYAENEKKKLMIDTTYPRQVFTRMADWIEVEVEDV